MTNAIWKRYRQRLISQTEAGTFLDTLIRCPVHIESSAPYLSSALQIAIRYDHAVYDALFVAAAVHFGLGGITADEPLYNVIHADFPMINLLRHWP